MPEFAEVGDCIDNAMCELFFATLECEFIERESFADRSEARRAVFDFVEGFGFVEQSRNESPL
jgi:putative transposase